MKANEMGAKMQKAKTGLKSENQETSNKGDEMKTGANGIRLETAEQKAKVVKWNGALREEVMEKALRREIAETLEMLKAAEAMLKAGAPEASGVMEKGDEMEKGKAALTTQKADQTQALLSGEAKVEMVKEVVAEYFEEAENQDGMEVWNGMETAEIAEDLDAWLSSYGPNITAIAEKGEEMETGSVKVKMVKGMVKEYFAEAENQDGMEVWEAMSVSEIKEDLAIWLGAYGPNKPCKVEISIEMEKELVYGYLDSKESLPGSEEGLRFQMADVMEDYLEYLRIRKGEMA